MLSSIFGDKPWYRSLTAWGIILFTAGAGLVAGACEQGLLGVGFCAGAKPIIQAIGAGMTAAGLRKATQANADAIQANSATIAQIAAKQ